MLNMSNIVASTDTIVEMHAAADAMSALVLVSVDERLSILRTEIEALVAARTALVGSSPAPVTTKVATTSESDTVVPIERGQRKAQILALLAAGDLSAKEIADQLGTHVGYVYTVKRAA